MLSAGRTYSLAVSTSTAGSSSAKATRPLYGSSSLAPFPTDLKLCLGSYMESTSENNITVIGLNPQLVYDPDSYAYNNNVDSSDFVPLAKAKTPYPVTKVDFSPVSLASKLQASTAAGSETREMIATTSDCLRLWNMVGPQEVGSSYVGRQSPRSHTLVERSSLSNVSCKMSCEVVLNGLAGKSGLYGTPHIVLLVSD